MRDALITIALLGAFTAGPALAQDNGSSTGGSTQPAPTSASQTASRETPFTFTGDTALWSVAIKPDKTADFEQVMRRLQQALQTSANPEQRRQADGWKVVRLDTPLPNGSVIYVHVIHPVVAGANYSVMQALYDAFPDERQALYDLYRNAFDRNVSLAKGTVSVDLSNTATQTASAR